MWPFSKATVDLEKLARADDPKAPIASGRRLLEMVAELHSRGYEGLRVCPHLSPSGFDWRCFMVPKARLQTGHPCQFDHKAFFELDPRATYSTGRHWEPFGWKGVGAESAPRWADRFSEAFQQTCAESRLSDAAYVNWYRTMLHNTSSLVYSWDDYQHFDPLRVWGGDGTYPLPPQNL